MPVKCPRCRTKYGNKLLACPNCFLRNRDQLTFVPGQIVDRYYGIFTGQKYTHPPFELERELRTILAEGNYFPTSLVMEPGQTEGFFSTAVSPTGDVSIKYNGKMFDYLSIEDVRNFLKHEACHIFAIQPSQTLVPQTTEKMQSYLLQHSTAYDEYRVHQEFIKRWPNDDRFKEFKARELDNYGIALYTIRKAIRDGQFSNFLYILQNMSGIFQEIIYLKLVDSEKLSKWSNECEARAVFEFFDFWFQDFEFINNQSFAREKAISLVQLSATLSMSVNPIDLLIKDKCVFDVSSRDTFQNFWNARNDLQERVLIAAWIGRIT